MNIGVLISGRGSNLRSLIEAQVGGKLSAEIATVISNVPDASGLEIAASHGIPIKVINHKEFDSRKYFERALNKALILADIDLICLAGFMRILSDTFVNNWRDRLINVHPSLLPSFKGLNTHERALEAGVCFTGCTIHFVRPAMDDGPIILQAAIPTLPQDTPETLANRVLQQEHIIFPLAVRMIAEGRVKVEGNVVKIEGARFHSEPIINPFE
jgi:phosphoribosylglycinamide formyltransferase-1